MATPSVTETKTLLSVPFLVTRVKFTTGSDPGPIAHGGPDNTQPDMVLFTAVGSTAPTANDVTWVIGGQADDDNIQVDCEDDGNDAHYAYCIFFNAARQDGQSIASDNG